VLPALDLLGDGGGTQAQQIGEQVQTGLKGETVRREPLSPSDVGLQDAAGPVGDQDRLVEKLEEARDDARRNGVVGSQFDHGTATQWILLTTLIHAWEGKNSHSIYFGFSTGNLSGYCQKATAVSMVNGFHFAQL
jgi:hypothetical protein